MPDNCGGRSSGSRERVAAAVTAMASLTGTVMLGARPGEARPLLLREIPGSTTCRPCADGARPGTASTGPVVISEAAGAASRLPVGAGGFDAA